jgi:hypothetical protein
MIDWRSRATGDAIALLLISVMGPLPRHSRPRGSGVLWPLKLKRQKGFCALPLVNKDWRH